MNDQPDWRAIAANLVTALEMQREIIQITHVRRSLPPSEPQMRKLVELSHRVSTWEREALIALRS